MDTERKSRKVERHKRDWWREQEKDTQKEREGERKREMVEQNDHLLLLGDSRQTFE